MNFRLELDVADWEASAGYQGGYTAESQEVRWFRRLVRAMDAADQVWRGLAPVHALSPDCLVLCLLQPISLSVSLSACLAVCVAIWKSLPVCRFLSLSHLLTK